MVLLFNFKLRDFDFKLVFSTAISEQFVDDIQVVSSILYRVKLFGTDYSPNFETI